MIDNKYFLKVILKYLGKNRKDFAFNINKFEYA